jgi:hypothetical protein
MKIQVEEQGGAIIERTMQDIVEQTIFSKVHEKWYTLAGDAPICNGALFQDFGYTANIPALRAVLDGTYVAPTDLDSATNELFAEIAAIHKLIPANLVSITIMPRTMGTILEGCEQGDIVTGVRSSLWPL